MKLSEWLDSWSMTSLKINTAVLNMEFKPNDYDKNASWEMYVELITRSTTQELYKDEGDEEYALKSIYSLFDITREILKKYGRHGNEFSKIAIIILNQKIRPFTSKWHKKQINGAFENSSECLVFRDELKSLQKILMIYMQMLSDIAGIENLTKSTKEEK